MNSLHTTKDKGTELALSVVINTKNAEQFLDAALESVKWAGQIVVVDMASTDETIAIAKKHKAEIFTFKDVGFVEPARNFAISKTKHDWVLILDADESIPDKLADWIHRLITGELPAGEQAECFYLPRRNFVFGREMTHTGWWPDYQLRLFRRGSVQWSDEIHSIPITQGRVKELPARPEIAIQHQAYQTVSQYLNRLDRYTAIESHQKEVEHISPAQLWRQFGDDVLRRLFADEGWRDGNHGVYLSLLQGTYQSTTLFKAWETKGFQAATHSASERDSAQLIAEMSAWQHQLSYWIADWHVKHTSGMTQLWWRFRRKIQR
jgi:glycosyltransferase involved in cell wall biosynthesis